MKYCLLLIIDKYLIMEDQIMNDLIKPELSEKICNYINLLNMVNSEKSNNYDTFEQTNSLDNDDEHSSIGLDKLNIVFDICQGVLVATCPGHIFKFQVDINGVLNYMPDYFIDEMSTVDSKHKCETKTIIVDDIHKNNVDIFYYDNDQSNNQSNNLDNKDDDQGNNQDDDQGNNQCNNQDNKNDNINIKGKCCDKQHDTCVQTNSLNYNDIDVYDNTSNKYTAKSNNDVDISNDNSDNNLDLFSSDDSDDGLLSLIGHCICKIKNITEIRLVDDLIIVMTSIKLFLLTIDFKILLCRKMDFFICGPITIFNDNDDDNGMINAIRILISSKNCVCIYSYDGVDLILDYKSEKFKQILSRNSCNNNMFIFASCFPETLSNIKVDIIQTDNCEDKVDIIPTDKYENNALNKSNLKLIKINIDTLGIEIFTDRFEPIHFFPIMLNPCLTKLCYSWKSSDFLQISFLLKSAKFNYFHNGKQIQLGYKSNLDISNSLDVSNVKNNKNDSDNKNDSNNKSKLNTFKNKKEIDTMFKPFHRDACKSLNFKWDLDNHRWDLDK